MGKCARLEWWNEETGKRKIVSLNLRAWIGILLYRIKHHLNKKQKAMEDIRIMMAIYEAARMGKRISLIGAWRLKFKSQEVILMKYIDNQS